MPRAPIKKKKRQNGALDKALESARAAAARSRLAHLRIPHAGLLPATVSAPKPRKLLTLEQLETQWEAGCRARGDPPLRQSIGLHDFWRKVNFFAGVLDPDAAAMDDALRQKVPHHWSGILQQSTKEIFLYSVAENYGRRNGMTAGRICGATPYNAAQRLVGGTHRLATKQEIAGWHAEQKQRKLTAEAWLLRANEWQGNTVKFVRAKPGEANVSLTRYMAPLRITPRLDVYGNPIPPIPPVALPEIPILQEISARLERWALKIWNHPRAKAARLYFYHPSPDNDDWLTDTAKRSKVLKRCADVLNGSKPTLWVKLREHYEYVFVGFGVGTLFWILLGAR